MNFLTELVEQIRGLFNPRFAAGRNAEQLFEELAHQSGWIVERIPQDRASFDKYAQSSARSIKRGDFIIRNARNTEVEVKCFSRFDWNTPGYLLRYSHVKRHEQMQHLTESPVVFAIFERRGRRPVPGSLRMVPLSDLLGRRSPDIQYLPNQKCLHIPLDSMYRGFDLLSRFRIGTDGRRP
jgi:hypothetical protein